MAFKFNLEPRKCAYCGKIFQPKTPRMIYCKGPHYMTCPICSKTYKVTNNDKLKLPPTACSYACRTVARTRTSLERYGCIAPGNNPEARRKASDTMMKNLGVPYAMMSEEVRQKSVETNLTKYGVANVGSNPDIIAKRMKTNMERYDGVMPFNKPESYEKRHKTVMERFGCEPLAAEEVIAKIRQTMMQKHGAPYVMQCPDLKKKQQATMCKLYGSKCAFGSPIIRKRAEKTMIQRYGVTNAAYSEELMIKAKETMIKRYGKCSRTSIINEKFSELLNQHNISHDMELFKEGKWFDFILEDQNIVIEINPSYTHSIEKNHWGTCASETDQLDKTLLANKYGLRCIHIWDWDNKNKIVSMLTPVSTKIYARKCKLFVLYADYAKNFLEKYSIYPTDSRKKLYLGLVYNDDLVEIMSFTEYLHDDSYDYELVDICTKPGYQVIGGASKLFYFATHEYEMNNIVTTCDMSKFEGYVFENIGMTKINELPPARHWSYADICIEDEDVTPHFVEKMFGIKIQEEDIYDFMTKNYWRTVYDCGQSIYEWRK